MTRPMPGPCEHPWTAWYYACTACSGMWDDCDEHTRQSKRLKDAECWSEHHHADAAWAKAMVQVLMGYRPMTDELNAGLKLQIAEAETWHRFATHPHAFKETHDDRP